MSRPKAQFSSPSRLGGSENGLAYHIFNPSGTESVLLLHGAGTGAPEWNLVIPHFPQDYHLLVPDLPLHNDSKNVGLRNIAKDTSNLLARLVTGESKGGQVHVVGLSLGAHVGRRLAVQHPAVVRSCLLSGYARLDFDWMPLALRNYVPHLIYGVEHLGLLIPKSWMDNIEHTDQTTTSHAFANFKKIWEMVIDEDMKEKPWGARTLMVAATKGGLIPTNDSVKDAQYLAELGRKGNDDTSAVQNRKMRHAWNRQDPELFAEAAMCWIESTSLPAGFEPI
ncbi:hypothetical protein SLS60_004135 [Paraconiothyrium brasiliense]|uniref:AB hydrolase-1 domain-containing protein n=1 Tax=Paraconiothyrium brasiliense TaxID=300254 RepID=A0ABR3RQK9_9PLEO